MSDDLPLPENRRAIHWHWIVLGMLVLVHAGFGAWAYSSSTSSAVKSILMGFILAQPFLFAFWAAYAPQHFYQRFLWSLLLCLIVSFTGDVGGGRTELGVLMIVDVILFMLATPVFLLIRRCYGWQITVTDGEFITSDYQRYQFGVRHLLFLTTILALGLGLIRTLLLMSISPFLPIAKLIVIVAMLFALLIPAIVLSWLMLSNRWVHLVYYLLYVGLLIWESISLPNHIISTSLQIQRSNCTYNSVPPFPSSSPPLSCVFAVFAWFECGRRHRKSFFKGRSK